MNIKNNFRNIPIPLIVIFLIILFLSGLILSSVYFQSRLQEIIFSSKELTIDPEQTVNRLRFGVEGPGNSDVYLIELCKLMSSVLKSNYDIGSFSLKDGLAALDSNRIDVFVTDQINLEEDQGKYYYSDEFISNNQILIMRKSDRKLKDAVNFAIGTILTNGLIFDLKQKFLKI